VASQPHPERKSVLIDVKRVDALRHSRRRTVFLERTYRQMYSFDSRNSSIVKTRATPGPARCRGGARITRFGPRDPAAAQRWTDGYAAARDDSATYAVSFMGFYYNFAEAARYADGIARRGRTPRSAIS
jgi:hypothetical protein